MAFASRCVIVTGGGAGLGRAISRTFALNGARVVIADIDAEAGVENTQFIQDELKGQAKFIQTDVSNEESVKNMVSTAVKEFGRIDVLINNAGVSTFGGLFQDNAVELFDRVLAINLRGTFLCAKYCAEQMVKSGQGGSMVNICSTRAKMSEPNTEAYSASKGGVLALTHSLAISLGRHGIRVNSISPGWIDVTRHQKSTSKVKPQELTERDHKQHPCGRVGVPNDIAEACLFLANPNNSFITGANLTIDGGMTVKMIYE